MQTKVLVLENITKIEAYGSPRLRVKIYHKNIECEGDGKTTTGVRGQGIQLKCKGRKTKHKIVDPNSDTESALNLHTECVNS